jgi:hypothetical protein
MSSSYYDESLSFTLDLMRKLASTNNSTSITFAAEELPIYQKICSLLQRTMTASIDGNNLKFSWGNGNLPTKNIYFTPFHEQSIRLKRTQERIKAYISGKPDPKSEEMDFF